MLSLVDTLFPAGNLSFTLSDSEFTIKDLFGASICFLPPPRRGKFLLLDNLLDDSLRRRKVNKRLGGADRTGNR
jgi:hypothetical protein